MSNKHTLYMFLLLSLLICSLVSCDIPTVSIRNEPTITTTNTTPGDQGQNTPQLNTWYPGARGVELRYEDWKSPASNEDTVTIVRFDLHHVKLSVAYQPDQPLSITDWEQQEHATAIINGGYFDDQNRATALVISNGQRFGTSYDGFGGMLAVDSRGNISLRSLQQHPYDPGNEQLRQATQSSPMLILNGKATQFNSDARSSRRSIAAIDKQGRLLFIVSPNAVFSLGELEDLLAASDLSIDRAVNLDGGASTALYVNSGNQKVEVDSITSLPLVIIVQTK
ncbi:MAG: phosphodiester glycosidase family protein [Ktedonobacteraceae bacterium]